MKTQVPSFAPTPEAIFQPDYEETMTATTLSQSWSPGKPLIADLQVEHVNLASRKITLKQGAHLFVLTLIAPALVDAKAMASISRKMAVQNKAEETKTTEGDQLLLIQSGGGCPNLLESMKSSLRQLKSTNKNR